jgi:hypothetical protein
LLGTLPNWEVNREKFVDKFVEFEAAILVFVDSHLHEHKMVDGFCCELVDFVLEVEEGAEKDVMQKALWQLKKQSMNQLEREPFC